MSEHTPGPWSLEGRYILGPERDNFADGHIEKLQIAVCAVDYSGGGNPEQVANARLIASAPELLAALNRIIEEPNNTLSDAKALREIVRVARIAIAKSVGKQP